MLNKYVMFFGDVTKWIDDGSPVDIIYLDLKSLGQNGKSKSTT